MNVLYSTTGNLHESRVEGTGVQPLVEGGTKKYMAGDGRPFAGLISFLLRYKFALLTLYVGLISAVAIFLVLFLPPKYEVSAIISLLTNKPYDVDVETSSARPPRQPPPRERQAEAAIALLGSESVIKEAIEAVGASNMYPASDNDIDEAYLSAKHGLTVRQEGVSEVILVKFHHRDPNLAVSFMTAVLNSFTARYARLSSGDRAVALYVVQKKQNSLELEKTEKALYNFSSANRMFKASKQIAQLVEQRSRQVYELSETRGLIKQKEAQESEIPTQLARMKPFARYPQIKNMISATKPETSRSNTSSGNIGNRRNGSAVNADKQSSEGEVNEVNEANIDREVINRAFSGSDPPLLLVRLYQETIASLVKTQVELAGLRALEAHQRSAISKIEDELDSIASKQSQFDQLQDEVSYRKTVDQIYTNKITDLKVSHNLGANNLSNVEIIQQVTVPRESMRRWYVGLIGIALCLAPFIAIFVFRHWPSLIVSGDDARIEHRIGAAFSQWQVAEVGGKAQGRPWAGEHSRDERK